LGTILIVIPGSRDGFTMSILRVGEMAEVELPGGILPADLIEAPLIAIVDDDASFRTALGRLLRLWGFRIESFPSAEAFLQQPTSAHCIVLDLHLGGMSGLELQARLAAEGRAVPIVFVSAMEDLVIRGRALSAGAAAYLEKPFDERRLLQVLSQVIDYRAA
jgi:FixJ family two-component response regulator